MSNLSLAINTKNEIENLRAVFNCVSSIIDEIVVVDCGSTDGTRELARKLGARVYDIGECPGYGNMRSLTLHLCKTDWCLFLDGDERLLEHDVHKIPDLIKMDYDLISLPRQHYRAFDMSICENPDISIYADWQARLIRVKPYIYWVRRVHEQIRGIEKGRELRELSNPVIRHFGFLKTQERLDSIVKLCNRLYKEDNENRDSYVLENMIGCAAGEKYWREAPLYHQGKHV